MTNPRSQLFIMYVNGVSNMSDTLRFVLFSDDTSVFY